MTTTAAQPCRATYRDRHLMSATFEIKKRSPRELPPPEDSEKVGVMRLRTRQHLSARGLDHIADEAILIVSELVTNAIVHSGGQQITVAVSLHDDSLRIEVRDGVPSRHGRPRAPRDADEHGRGLVLVQLLAEEGRGAWGVVDGGASTWCELSLAACR